jgi:hypothetical protein
MPIYAVEASWRFFLAPIVTLSIYFAHSFARASCLYRSYESSP